MPNLAVKRRANGMPARPLHFTCRFSVPGPVSHSAVSRLPLRYAAPIQPAFTAASHSLRSLSSSSVSALLSGSPVRCARLYAKFASAPPTVRTTACRLSHPAIASASTRCANACTVRPVGTPSGAPRVTSRHSLFAAFRSISTLLCTPPWRCITSARTERATAPRFVHIFRGARSAHC